MLATDMGGCGGGRSRDALDGSVAEALDAASLDWSAARPAMARLVARPTRGIGDVMRHPSAGRIRCLGMAWAVTSGRSAAASPEEGAHVVQALSGAPSSEAFRGMSWPAGCPWVGDVRHARIVRVGARGALRLRYGSVPMGRVAGCDAPVAMILATPAGGMALRVHMGRVFRPVLLPGGWEPCPSSLLADIAPDPPAWADNPFVRVGLASADGSRGGALLAPAEAVVATAGRDGEHDPAPALADIDGIAHRACDYPVLDVAIVSRQGGTVMRPGWRIGHEIDSESVQGTLGLAWRSVEWVGDDLAGMVPRMPASSSPTFEALSRAMSAVVGAVPAWLSRECWASSPVDVCRADLLPDHDDPLPAHVRGIVLPALAATGAGPGRAAAATLLAAGTGSSRARAKWALAHAACAAGDEAARRAADDAAFADTFPAL